MMNATCITIIVNWAASCPSLLCTVVLTYNILSAHMRYKEVFSACKRFDISQLCFSYLRHHIYMCDAGASKSLTLWWWADQARVGKGSIWSGTPEWLNPVTENELKPSNAEYTRIISGHCRMTSAEWQRYWWWWWWWKLWYAWWCRCDDTGDNVQWTLFMAMMKGRFGFLC